MFKYINKAINNPGKLILHLIALPFCIFIILIIRLIRPVIIIRIGPIRADVIGASMQRTEYYLTYLDVNKLKPLDFFYFNHKPPNQQWELMVRRKLVVNQIFFYEVL